MPLSKAVIIQFIACLIIILSKPYWSQWTFANWQLVLFQILIASSLSKILGQAIWWRLMHLIFLPALLILMSLHFPAWTYLLIFLLLLLLFWGTVNGDVPLFLSSTTVVSALKNILNQENPTNFVDLGVGLGSVVYPLAIAFPAMPIVGLEKAPLPWLWAKFRCKKQTNVTIRYESLWQSHLSEYAIAFAFLSPPVMEALGQKLKQEMRTGSLFISSSFPVPDWQAEKTIVLNDRQKTCLYCYRIQSEK